MLSKIVCGVSGDSLKKRFLAATPVQLKLDRREVAVSVKILPSSEAIYIIRILNNNQNLVLVLFS